MDVIDETSEVLKIVLISIHRLKEQDVFTNRNALYSLYFRVISFLRLVSKDYLKKILVSLIKNEDLNILKWMRNEQLMKWLKLMENESLPVESFKNFIVDSYEKIFSENVEMIVSLQGQIRIEHNLFKIEKD